MQLLPALELRVLDHDPKAVRNEMECSCGHPNHARLVPFRVDGRPVTVVIPEAAELNSELLKKALRAQKVEHLSEQELDAAMDLAELGRLRPFDSAFGTSVFVDERLLGFGDIVFCPHMFARPRGECIRIGTVPFLQSTHAVTLALTTA